MSEQNMQYARLWLHKGRAILKFVDEAFEAEDEGRHMHELLRHFGLQPGSTMSEFQYEGRMYGAFEIIWDLQPLKCWCGITTTGLHYPCGDPENGPAHRPSSGCDKCGGEPHPGYKCFQECECPEPRPMEYEFDDGPTKVCVACGCEVAEGR